MIIKFIHHNGKKRQTKVSQIPNFEELRNLSLKIWGDSVKNCLFGYIDCDEELITIVNQDDWEVCVEEMESLQEDKKIGKIIVRILVNDEINTLAESVVIGNVPTLETEVSVAPTENFDTSRIEDSTFNLVADGFETETPVETPVETPEETPVEAQEETPEEAPVEEEKVSLPALIVQEAIQRSLEAVEQVKNTDQLDEWKMVNKSQKSEEPVEEEGDDNIVEETTEQPQVEEEESVFDEEAAPVRVINTNPEDCVIDIKVDGNDLEAVRQQVLELAPLMGFEVDVCQIVDKKPEVVPEPEIKENDLNVSTCETGRSTMTIDMKDEIQKMIQERVKEELMRSGLSTTAPVEEDKCDTVHTGFSCDGCGINPIKGVRFHSLVKQNFDLCAKCEKKMHQEHPMIRFRKNTHRGLAHGRGWTKMNKIVTNHGNGLFNVSGRCTRNNRRQQHVVKPEDVMNFFTNGIFGGAKRGCGVAGKTLGDHIKQAAKDVKKVAKDIKKEMKKDVEEKKEQKKRGRANLCHVRTRPVATASCTVTVGDQPVEAPKVERHPRFNEFSKVFTNAVPDELDAFLKKNKDLKDDNELYNKAIGLFLN